MNESENIEKVVNALREVPEKKLTIIALANSIPIKFGELDPKILQEKATEIELAVVEARSYGSETIIAVESLLRVKPIPQGGD